MLAEYWSTLDYCIGRYVDQYAGLHSTDMVNGVSADTRLCVSWHVSWYMASMPVVTWLIKGVSIVGRISVDCWWNIGRLLVANWSTVVWYNMCFKTRMWELSFSVVRKILWFRGLKIVSFLLFVPSHVGLAASTCWISAFVLGMSNVRLSLNTSQGWWYHSGPNFFQKTLAHTWNYTLTLGW